MAAAMGSAATSAGPITRVSIEKQDDHLYYNVNQYNSAALPVKMGVRDFRSDPFIIRPSDYHVSVIRFKIPASTIPIFAFRPQPGTPTTGNTNMNLGIYSVTMSYVPTATNVRTFLVYVPDNNFDLPLSWLNINENNLAYYSIYSYQQFITEMNVALATSYAAMPAASPPKLAGAPAPYFIYNPETSLISLIADRTFDPAFVGGPTIEIWVNYPLGTFLTGLESVLTIGNDPLGKDARIIVKNNNNNLYTPPGPVSVFNFYEMKQNGPALDNWADIQRIVFVSGSLPLKTEFIPTVSDGSSSTDNFLPILTDFEPLINSGPLNLTYLQYFPQGPYRLTDLKSDTPLNVMDIRVYWSDKQGNLFPVLLAPGANMSIKILFQRKDF